MKHYRKLKILMLSAILLMIVNCESGSRLTPRCMAWSEVGTEELVAYIEEHGRTPMVESILRDAQVCRALGRI